MSWILSSLPSFASVQKWFLLNTLEALPQRGASDENVQIACKTLLSPLRGEEGIDTPLSGGVAALNHRLMAEKPIGFEFDAPTAYCIFPTAKCCTALQCGARHLLTAFPSRGKLTGRSSERTVFSGPGPDATNIQGFYPPLVSSVRGFEARARSNRVTPVRRRM